MFNAKKSEKQDKEEKDKLKKVCVLNSCGMFAHSNVDEKQKRIVQVYNYYIFVHLADRQRDTAAL